MSAGSLVDTVRVGHTTWAWSSCIFHVDGQGTEGVLAIDYDEQLETRVVYSNQQDSAPLGQSGGRYKIAAFPLKMLADAAVVFKDYLQQKAASAGVPSGSYGQAVFTLTMQLASADSPIGVPSTIIFADCRVVGEKAAHEEGVDAAVTEFKIGCLGIFQDDLTLWNALPPDGPGFPVADTITIGPTTAPGKWTLEKADKVFGWQIRAANAMSGATVVPIGDELVEAEFTVEFWDPADFLLFLVFRSTYLKKPVLGVVGAAMSTSKALSIGHPELAAQGCTKVVVKKVGAVLNDGFGVWTCKVTFLQYLPPKPAPSKPNAAIPPDGKPTPTAKDAQQQEMLDLTAQMKALVAKLNK